MGRDVGPNSGTDNSSPGWRGGGAGFNDGTAQSMQPQPIQTMPNTVNWGGGVRTMPGATNVMGQNTPGATLGNPTMSNPIVSSWPTARGKG